MKKILKSPSPNVLTVFAHKYPAKKWDDFRDFNSGDDYSKLKTLIFKYQGQLCAYCETKIENTKYEKQRIEHFHDKSQSTQTNNLHLKWDNVFGVCLGGSDIRNKENPLFPTPANLSCDAYKEYKNVSYTDILNPLELLAFPSLFKFEKKSGKLQVNEDNCRETNIDIKLVENTIINLNLNCDRLITDRYKVLIAYNKEIEKGRKVQDKNVFKKLAQKWFSQKYPSFFTTRRILLGKHAENYLREINYDG